MNKILTFLLLMLPMFSYSQHSKQVFVSDVQNFWHAYDSMLLTNNVKSQIEVIESLYVSKGTEGLRAFMALRNFGSEHLVKAINAYPKFWKSIRANTMKVMDKKDSIDHYIQIFRNLYPDYREAQIYFTITALRSGGTTQDNLVLIGTEIAVGNAETEVSEFPDPRLANFFGTQKHDNIVPFVVHEYVHTQQREESPTLIGQSIYEGACDFITELVLNKPLDHSYLNYGKKHEQELRKQFKQEMWSSDFSNWLYNGATVETVGDLGYFMGYVICKSYYIHTTDKKQAIKNIIELPYANREQVESFVKQSKYFD